MIKHLTPYEHLKAIADRCLQAQDKEKAVQYMKSFSDVFMGFSLTATISPEEARKLIPVIRSLRKHFAAFDKNKLLSVKKKSN